MIAALAAGLLGWAPWFPDVTYGPGATLRDRPSWTDGIVLDLLAPDSGPPLEAAVDVIARFAADESKTDLLLLVGRSARGVWTLEANAAEGDVVAHLALAGASGRRRVWPLGAAGRAAVTAVAAEALRDLVDRIGWLEGRFEPVEPVPLGEPPKIAYAETPRGRWHVAARAAGRPAAYLAEDGGIPGRRFEAAVWAARAPVAAGDWVWALAKTRTAGRVRGAWGAAFVPAPSGGRRVLLPFPRF